MTKKELNKQYKSLIAYTGMGGGCWAMLSVKQTANLLLQNTYCGKSLQRKPIK